jgi:nitrogen fixation NifU-like protein
MADLRELYQQTILDHNRSPRNYHKLEDATKTSEGYNPLCGDHITVYLHMENGVIQDISFQGSGCAISKASASIMSSVMKGKTAAEAEELFRRFHSLVTEESGEPADLDSLGKLAVFAGVREFPARVKCASLAWHTLHAALHEDGKPASTE